MTVAWEWCDECMDWVEAQPSFSIVCQANANGTRMTPFEAGLEMLRKYHESGHTVDPIVGEDKREYRPQ